MCGISGFINYAGSKIDEQLFEKMTDTLAHRGPDDRGTFYIDNIALGHRRLSIIDLSKDGHQPMHYLDKYSIVFNGEIYNYIELKNELLTQGYRFNSQTDTEVIMAAYDLWGEECLNRFNGMWALGIYDREKRELFCARDRFGVKPFYYCNDGSKFIFASEIKAILCYNKAPKANIPRLMENIISGCFDHTDETLFEGVKQLQPGYCLKLDTKDNHLEIKQWYNLYKIKENKRSYKDSVLRFRELFIDSIKLRLRSDVSVGSCLSGGLDSSSIVCSAAGILKQQAVSAKQKTVSSCYNGEDEKNYDEQEYIDEVVNSTGVAAKKVYTKLDVFLKDLDKVIYHQDEPVGGILHASHWSVFKTAKQAGLKVMLDGQGSDEQLAGYTPFYSVIIKDYIKGFRLISAAREMYFYIKLRNKHESLGLKYMLWLIAKDFMPDFLSKALFKKAASDIKDTLLKVPFDKGILESIGQYKNFDIYAKNSMRYGLVQLLHYEDRSSMAHSIEGRLPFLDFRLVEHILSLPPEYRLKNGVTKRILRNAVDGIIPDKIKNRMSKLGFAVPSDLWIIKNWEFVRNELIMACDILAPIIDKQKILKWLDESEKEKICMFNTLIWRIICVGRWGKIFNVRFA
ncbi:MAG: asparagine synthase (glutamine-hydrolyzing) [Deltaproteobacteria bacterium]